MAGAVIPTFPDVANYTIAPQLEGVTYLLTFRLSAREACYYLDLATNDGTLLVTGKKLVCGISIYKHQRYNLLVPQGALACATGAGQSDDPPNLGDLGVGRRCTLFYFTKAELGGA